jgi:DNA-binding GntR family transcriptional regulator
VASIDAASLHDLFALRLALEREAAALALAANDGRLPPSVHAAAEQLDRVAARPRSAWADVALAHNAVHRALVHAPGAPRIARAYDALETEMRLFVTQLRPAWTRARLGPDHLQLLADLERDGPDVLREHMAEAERALATAGGR